MSIQRSNSGRLIGLQRTLFDANGCEVDPPNHLDSVTPSLTQAGKPEFDQVELCQRSDGGLEPTISDRESIITLARMYHDWGWTVVPLKTGQKVPAIKWRRLIHSRLSSDELTKFFGPRSYGNIGIVLGKASNNLIVRDFDLAEEYESWAQIHPELASRLPTVRTARGHHVYLVSSEGITATHCLRPFASEGEIRGDGGYVVAPGSVVARPSDQAIESNGVHRYVWSVRPVLIDGYPVIPTVSLIESGLVPEAAIPYLLPPNIGHSGYAGHSGRIGNKRIDEGEGEVVDSQKIEHPDLTDSNLKTLVANRAINGCGKRRTALKDLALDLIVPGAEKPSTNIRRIAFGLWWESYGKFCTTSREESWLEFDRMIDELRGRGFITGVARELESIASPTWLRTHNFEEVGCGVMRVFFACDRITAGNPFFISMRDIAKLIGFGSLSTVQKVVFAFDKMGFCKIVKKGTCGKKGNANTYQVLVDHEGKRRSNIPSA